MDPQSRIELKHFVTKATVCPGLPRKVYGLYVCQVNFSIYLD
jgi:hypothetical protein